MDPLPQELIDKIIDDLPHSSLGSCSLVARHWRRRSQERIFAFTIFSSEYDLVLWCTKIPQVLDGIPSYVRAARFGNIRSWDDPALFGRVLKELTSLKVLFIIGTRIPRPDELPNSTPYGEFGKTIERLLISSPPQCTAATITSLALSFPNLEDFRFVGDASAKEPLTILPYVSQRRPLASLVLMEIPGEVGIALARCGLTSRKLSLTVYDAGLEQLLTLSSEVIVELKLSDEHPSPNEKPPAISLPPFPAITTVNIVLRGGEPSARLVYILSCIHSAPVLTSIVFTSEEWPAGGCSPSGLWADVDEWLVRMATQAKAKGGLTAILVQQPDDRPVWEGCLPKFRKAGGEVRIEVTTDDDSN